MPPDDRILVHGPTPARVELAEYDPAWPDHFARHRDRLRATLGDRARLVEHIGSTAVPGLPAKPVIDVVVGIDDPDDEDAFLPDLTAAGYDLRIREPGHRALRGTPDEAEGLPPVNVHCYAPEDDAVHRYRLLRDHLRASPRARADYERAKRALAGREWPDVNHYAEAKGPTIRALLREATAITP